MINILNNKNYKDKFQSNKYDYRKNIKFDKNLYYNIKRKYFDIYYIEEMKKFNELEEIDKNILINKYKEYYNKYLIDNKIEIIKSNNETMKNRIIDFLISKKSNQRIYKLYLYIENKRNDIDKNDYKKYNSINIINNKQN